MTRVLQTVRAASWVYGAGPDPDDPAERYHLASKLQPVTAARAASANRRIEENPELAASIRRAVRRRGSPRTTLPPPCLRDLSLTESLHGRVSERAFGQDALRLSDAAGLLWAGYGSRETSPGGSRRTVPSGGALYPLELYALVQRVDGLEPAVYHYDPTRHELARVAAAPLDEELELLTPFPELVRPAALVVLVTAVFWRTRFKYGLRGYRFALLEAGHVGQNALLAAAALDLAAVPVGGLYDARVEALLGIDGIDEALVYALSFGSRPTS